MKRTLQTLLLALVALPMLAQTEEHDNRLYLTVGEVTENNQVELSLHLENPSIALTAVELYVTLPDGATLAAGSLAARAMQHTLTEGAVEGKHFVSIASSSLTTFAGIDGALCTWVCDLSQLEAGNYNILTTGLFAVSVADGMVTAYTAEEQTLHIVSTPTGIADPTSEIGKLIIYDLSGRRVESPTKGLHVVNGKKVLF